MCFVYTFGLIHRVFCYYVFNNILHVTKN